MKYKISHIIIFSALLLISCGKYSESQKLHNFFAKEWEYGLVEYPEFATGLGDYRFNDRLTDMSLKAIKNRYQHTHNSFGELKTIRRERLNTAGQLNYDLYYHKLEKNIYAQQFQQYLIPIDQMGGIQINAPNMVDEMPFENKSDFDNYIIRLELLPNKINQIIKLMKVGVSTGVLPSKVVLSSVPNQIKAQYDIDVVNSPFFAPFKVNPGIEGKIWDEIIHTGSQLIEYGIFPAFEELHRYFLVDYLPNTRGDIAASSLPNGNVYYQYLIEHHTTTELTAVEIHQLGLKEVNRIHKEMQKVIDKLSFNGTFSEFLTFLRTDKRFYYSTAEELINGYRTICKKADPELAALFGTLPRVPYGVKPIPDYQAPAAPTAYYYSGTDDGSRPGYFWANTYKLHTRPKYEMAVLALHEAMPGHHLQIALAHELDGLPEFRKKSGYTAFVEGWALYAESLGETMGMYTDPYDKFGQLTYEMWRACRLVVDTGIHMLGWTRQDAIDFMFKHTAKTLNDIQVEVDRYIAWPGQALAYKIGELKIQELRSQAEEQLGKQFDIREFHDKILENGAIPLELLTENINNYIQQKLSID